MNGEAAFPITGQVKLVFSVKNASFNDYIFILWPPIVCRVQNKISTLCEAKTLFVLHL
jgi:hypothetical protein